MTVFWRRALTFSTAVAILGCAAGELVVRNDVTSRFGDAAAQRLGIEPEVDLGSTPALVQLAQGVFPSVRIAAEGVTFRGITHVSLQVDLHDVEPDDGAVTVGQTKVRAEASVDALAKAVEQRFGRGGTVMVTAHPQEGLLRLHTGPGRAVAIAMRPQLEGSTLTLTPAGATIAGREIPQLGQQTPQSIDLSGLPLQLQPTAVSVTENGLRLELTGQRTTIAA